MNIVITFVICLIVMVTSFVIYQRNKKNKSAIWGIYLGGFGAVFCLIWMVASMV